MVEPSRVSRTRSRTERDLARLKKAERNGHLWRAMGMIGSVGWPIMGLAIGGALLGRYLDERYATQARWTLALLGIGIVLGCVTAYRNLRGREP